MFGTGEFTPEQTPEYDSRQKGDPAQKPVIFCSSEQSRNQGC